MQLQLYRHDEPLEADELAFLQKKEAREMKSTYRVVRILLIFCFVIPYLISLFRATNGIPDPFSYSWYFSGVFFLLCFAGLCVYIAYYRTIHKVNLDIKHKTKTIERTTITSKRYMPHTNTFHFYLDSPNKLSIEVSGNDYHSMSEGDEINIEYTTHSNVYLGYF